MAPWTEIIVAALDLLSFILVTPLVLGQDRLVALLLRLERASDWIRGTYFARERQPVSLPMILGVLMMLVAFVVLTHDGVADERASATGALITALSYLLPTFIPAAVVTLYWIVARVAQRYGIERTLAILGAGMFMVARVVTITSAAMRL
jgi:hypothetical protein